MSGSDGAQSAEQVQSTTDLYLTTYDDAAASAETVATNFYRNRINLLTSVDSLINNASLYNYVLEAYGFDPAVESKAKIRQVLTSDLSSPTSFANLQADTRYRDLAAGFNFGADGTVQQPRKAQLDLEELGTIQLYNTRIGTSQSEQVPQRKRAPTTTTPSSRCSRSTRCSRTSGSWPTCSRPMISKDKAVSNDTLRRVLTSDPLDKDSFAARQSDTRYRDLAAAFNFTADGGIGRTPEEQAQTRSNILKTLDFNTRQTLEGEAGAENEGVRLALYFQRKAAGINSAFDILADKAIFEVVRTALALPVSMVQADIEVQADILIKRVNPQDFKDPAKLEKFISRFAALYDVSNSGTSGASAASIILGGQSANVGTNAGLLANLQRIALNRG